MLVRLHSQATATSKVRAFLSADAVIAVDIDYNSISTGSGINMMMVSVSGTAIKWKSTS